ncbi:MAG TPA: type II toxin-antitoxin system VapC family toxin [Candidatus Cloacimonadota bacterium]|nr:type II toxin-antitoxin system VapC family toxin [Candidatus Cloacimonadota bacterium]
MNYLLDASAVIAFLLQEPGWEKVSDVLLARQATITSVNLAEVATILVRCGASYEDACSACRDLALHIIDVDAAIALESVRLAPDGKRLGLSLGDRICLAAAKLHGCVALTGDRVWQELSDYRVVCFR